MCITGGVAQRNRRILAAPLSKVPQGRDYQTTNHLKSSRRERGFKVILEKKRSGTSD
jgi:hypothetical protein